jgi:hypothetical protein
MDPNPWAVVTLPLAVVCWIRRKDPIGGWLLWFIAQLILAACAAVYTVTYTWRHFLPATWHNPQLHLLYVLSRPPEFLASLYLAFAAWQASRSYAASTLGTLRTALVVRFCIGLVVYLLDTQFFPSLTTYDARTTGATVVVLLYLALSTRVDRVFVRQTWTWTSA